MAVLDAAKVVEATVAVAVAVAPAVAVAAAVTGSSSSRRRSRKGRRRSSGSGSGCGSCRRSGSEEPKPENLSIGTAHSSRKLCPLHGSSFRPHLHSKLWIPGVHILTPPPKSASPSPRSKAEPSLGRRFLGSGKSRRMV